MYVVKDLRKYDDLLLLLRSRLDIPELLMSYSLAFFFTCPLCSSLGISDVLLVIFMSNGRV